MKKIYGKLENVLELKNTSRRIVSLVPSITELLVDLGLENKIIGVTKFCVHPNSIRKDKTIVGGTKTINIDKIIALKPDIILCNKEENTKEIVVACKRITRVHVSDIYTISDTLKVISEYGKMFSCEKKSKKLILKILNQKNSFLEFVKDKKIKKVAYFIWKKPWMVAAENTFINHLLELNNFENIFQDKVRYPEINLSELKNSKNLDFIFLSSEPYPFKEKDILSLQSEFKKAKIILVDGEYFSWYGSRLVKAFDYFKNLRKEITK